jgi:hypothetical protein
MGWSDYLAPRMEGALTRRYQTLGRALLGAGEVLPSALIRRQSIYL